MFPLCLLLFSFSGYLLGLYLLFKGRKTAFYPSLIASSIIVGSFIAGLINCLEMFYHCVFAAGIALVPVGIFLIVRKKVTLEKPTLSTLYPFVVWIAGFFVLYFLLQGRFLYGYDDFSHWGKVVRAICENMRLPIESDNLTHGSYPPGSALFIAYISSVIGRSASVWLFANAILKLSYWLSLLAASKNILLQLVLSVFISSLMILGNSLEILYVDTLLAAMSFTSVAWCLRDGGFSKKRLVFWVLSLCTLVLTKNSGSFLALMIATYVIRLNKKCNQTLPLKLLVLVIPFLSLLAWRVHYNLHFLQSNAHEMSVEHYLEILKGKTPYDLLNTLKIVLPLVLNPLQNHGIALMPLFMLVLLILRFQGQLSENLHVFLFALMIFLGYEVGILLMYIFSMPMVEMLEQNGSDYVRYNSTVVAMLHALLLYLLCRVKFPAIKKGQLLSCTIVYATVLIAACSTYQLQSLDHYPDKGMEYRIKHYPSAYYFFQMEEELAEVPHNSSFIVFFQEPDTNVYNRYLSRYYTYSTDVIRCYDEGEALALRATEPWRYYIDLWNGTIHTPTKTVGIEQFTRSSTADQSNVLDTVGYRQNTRFSTTASADITAHHWDITGYIPIKAGDVLRLDNITWCPTEENDGYGGLYWYFNNMNLRSSLRTKTEEDLKAWQPVYDKNGYVVQITVPDNIGSTTGYLRLICQDINVASVITVSESLR